MQEFIRPSRQNPNAGFTLTELLISLSIIAILTAIAVPGFEHGVQKQQASSAMQTLTDQLELARHTAISSNHQVVLCTANLSDRHCINSSDWSAAVMSFIDNNRNTQLDEEEKVLAIITRLTPNGSLLSNGTGYLRFDPFGNIAGIGKSFRYCPESGTARFARGLSVNAQGRYRIWQDTDGNGVVDSNGTDISC